VDASNSSVVPSRQETLPTTLTSQIPARQPIEELANWHVAIRAAESKKALDLKILDLREVTSFTDYFVICSVANARQGQAISDEILKDLKTFGELPVSVEGFESAEWILMDYGDFIVHIFSASARSYYDLERLWRHAKVVDSAEYATPE
jgi:ribosome-associated protein